LKKRGKQKKEGKEKEEKSGRSKGRKGELKEGEINGRTAFSLHETKSRKH